MPIDHALIYVNDLERARETYERLGFALTARGHHAVFGTGNHLAVFHADYLELLGIETPGPENVFVQHALARSEGLSAVALATRNAHADAARLRKLASSEPEAMELSRPVRIGGRIEEARFRIARVQPALCPLAPLFYCEHLTPELVWRKECQTHPNGVTGVRCAVFTSADAVDMADAYVRLFGPAVAALPGDGFRVTLGTHHLEFVTPAALARRLPRSDLLPRPTGSLLEFRVQHLHRCMRWLSDSSVSFARGTASDVFVGAEYACGTVLRFVEEEVTP